MPRTYKTAVGTTYGQDDIGLAVGNAAATGEDAGRVAKVTAASDQLLGPIVGLGLPDTVLGQDVLVANRPGERVKVKLGENVTAGTHSPHLTAGADSKWYIATAGQRYAVRLDFSERAALLANDMADAFVEHGQRDTAP